MRVTTMDECVRVFNVVSIVICRSTGNANPTQMTAAFTGISAEVMCQKQRTHNYTYNNCNSNNNNEAQYLCVSYCNNRIIVCYTFV